MDGVFEIFKAFIGLYVDVFKNYPLAASITTLLFVLGYGVWMKINKEKGIRPDAVWKHPAFMLFVGWCILTPLLGLIIQIFIFLKNIVAVVSGIYVHVFKAYPEAGSIVTIVLLVVYLIWKLILKIKKLAADGIWRRPAIILIVVWLIITPITGFLIKWFEPKGGSSSALTQQSAQPQVEQLATSSEQKAPDDKK